MVPFCNLKSVDEIKMLIFSKLLEHTYEAMKCCASERTFTGYYADEDKHRVREDRGFSESEEFMRDTEEVPNKVISLENVSSMRIEEDIMIEESEVEAKVATEDICVELFTETGNKQAKRRRKRKQKAQLRDKVRKII